MVNGFVLTFTGLLARNNGVFGIFIYLVFLSNIYLLITVGLALSFQQGLSVSMSFYVLGPPFEFGGLITLPSSLPLTATAAAAPRGGMSSACVGLEGQLI